MIFNQWLKIQVKRDDPIGDLARDSAVDERRKPHNGNRGSVAQLSECSRGVQ